MATYKAIDIVCSKHFCLIDSPIGFNLYANAFQSSVSPTGWAGTDELYRPSGAWCIDCNKLLPKEYFKNSPVFKLKLVYDSELATEEQIKINYSDIDIGDGVAGVNGQNVVISNGAPIPVSLENEEELIVKINDINSTMKFVKSDSVKGLNVHSLDEFEFVSSGFTRLNDDVYLIKAGSLITLMNNGEDAGIYLYPTIDLTLSSSGKFAFKGIANYFGGSISEFYGFIDNTFRSAYTMPSGYHFYDGYFNLKNISITKISFEKSFIKKYS